jgi:methylase of polypeptide subunit release factors
METSAAKKLITDTFNYPFSEESFGKFARNLLDGLNESDEVTFEYHGAYIPEAFRSHIKQYQRVGKFVDPNRKELDVLVVHLKDNNKLDGSRTMQRNFVAHYLDKKDREAAIVAFRGEDPEDWRFSFIKMEYRQVVNEKGVVKGKREPSPAKRFSFLVGKNEPNHTAQQQILPLFQKNKKLSVSEIEQAFSVEQVTKQFYLQYRALFEKLSANLQAIIDKNKKVRQEFEAKHILADNFAKKLLGQIVFLYFLQKKGWLGLRKAEDWGQGPKNFFRQMYEMKYVKYKNFFNDLLEPLFYEALAKDRREKDSYYKPLDCKIPFLNGGLFEPLNGYDWKVVDINIENELFGEVLNVFDQYNFTVKEDDPLDKEVAVDPEMLGKVFENLLPENLRKGKGAYYTPTPIVHYMCQEALIQFLLTNCKDKVSQQDIEAFIHNGERYLEMDMLAEAKELEKPELKKKPERLMPESIRKHAASLDKKLAEIKVCDPAIGSGAFPMGLLHEIVKARNILSTYLPASTGRSLYNLKRHCIQESIYGVDVDPGAIDVAKLRMWLSLVVDETDYKSIKPLPNLDYKIMQGDSLVEEFQGIKLSLRKDERALGYIPDHGELFDGTDSELAALIRKLHDKHDKFFNAAREAEKIKYKEDVEHAIVDIFHYQLQEQKAPYFTELKNIERNASRLPRKTGEQYLEQETIKLSKKHGFNIERLEKELYEMTTGRKARGFFPWRLYFADIFGEQGGFDVVIGNPPYVQLQKLHKYADALKEQDFETYIRTGDIYSLFYERGVKLLKSKGTLVFITSNNWMRAAYGKSLRKFFLEKCNPLRLLDFCGHQVFETATVNTNILVLKNEPNTRETLTCVMRDDYSRLTNLSDYFRQNSQLAKNLSGEAGWVVLNDIEARIKSKIEAVGTPLKDWNININRGVLTGYNEAFIIDSDTRNRLVSASAKNAAIIRPILFGENIKRYHYQWKESWLINSHNGIKNQGIPRVDVIKDYPIIYEHLSKYKDCLIKRKDQGDHWSNLRNCTYLKDFSKPKIIYPEITKFINFYYDESDEFFVNNKCFILTGTHLEYLTCFFNSKLFRFCFLNNFPRLVGETRELRKIFFLEIPVIKVSDEINSHFRKVISNIHDTRKIGTTTEAIEEEANTMIFKLYRLTKQDIKVINQFDDEWAKR